LRGRRDAIAGRWHQAVEGTDCAPLDATEVRQRLVELTDRVVGLLLAEPFDHTEAHAIGAALARLDSLQPEALGRTQEVLACQLLEALPSEQVVALQPRLAALLGGLATGFFQQARDVLLAEQEQISGALEIELQRTKNTLRESEQTARALLNTPVDTVVLLEPDGTIVDLNEAAAQGLGKSRDELIGASALDMFPPGVAQHRRAQGERVISSGQPVRFVDQREGKWFDQSVYPVLDAQGKVARIAIVARDVTEHRRAGQALRKRAAQLALLNNIGKQITAMLQLDDVLDRVACLVQEGFGYHHVALFIADRERGELVMKSRAGDFVDVYPCDHRIELGQGMVGWVGCHGEPLLANDVRAEPRYVNYFPDMMPTRSELTVPVRVGEETIGVLDVQSPQLNAFDEEDVIVMQTLADQVAVAIQNARLYEAVQRELIERAQAEQAVRMSEARAQALLNAPTDAAVLMGLDGTIVAHNQALAERLDRGTSELVGLCAFDLVPPDLAERRKVRWNQVVRSGQPVRFEDQREGIWLDNSLYPVFGMQGEVVQIALFSRDITESRAMGEALRESELRYRTFFESVPVGVGLATLDGRVLTCNDAMVEMTGYSRKELEQINLGDTYRNPDERAQLLRQLHAGGGVRDSEVELVRKDGVPFYASLTMTPLTMGGADVLLTLAQDITENKQLEQHLVLSERLAAVGRFAAGLAHEINNPLQAICNNLELVLDFDLQPDERQGHLHIVRQEIEGLVEITQRALGFAQPGDGTRYPVKVADLVRRALELADRQLRQAHVQATADFPADLPHVLVAPKQIGQVLLNLITNAIEAMPQGGHLHMSARVDGDMVALAVSNDGLPIPSEHFDRLFEAFFTTKMEGTGLGLAISYRIVSQHGGTIRVENLSGDRGVTFTVTLPMAHVAKRQEVLA